MGVELHVQAPQCVGVPDATLTGHGEAELSNALKEAILHISGELKSSGGVFVDEYLETPQSGVGIGAVESEANRASDGGLLVEPGHISLGILREVKLAALPRRRWKQGPFGRHLTRRNHR